jgi:integrase
VGDEGDCGWAISSFGSQVSRHAALDLERAVRDQLILINPCEHTELPKIIMRRTRTLTPDEFGRLIAAIPERHRLLVAPAIETGMRWGELIALRPRHIDFLRRTVTVEETIVEVSASRSVYRCSTGLGQR